MRTTVNRKILISIVLAAIYVALPLLILLDVIDFAHKFYALTLGGIMVYVFCRAIGITNSELGITANNAWRSIRSVLPFTLVLFGAGIFLWVNGYSRITPNENWYFFIFYIFIASPIQEFLYRAVLDTVFEKFGFHYSVKMMASSLLYSFVHIIYRDALVLVLAFVAGLIWYACYQKTKNLTGVSLSHAILGAITIIAGIIN
jgi:membrane protease YdiL (CAAX protease family)